MELTIEADWLEKPDKNPRLAVIPDSPNGKSGIIPPVKREPFSSIIESLEQNCLHWLSAIRLGDQRALASFYDATVSRVYGLALRITQNAAAAEDVVAEVYIQVWRAADQYDPTRGPVLAWMLVMCRSRALDYLRRLESAVSMAEPEVLLEHTALDGANPQDLFLASEQNTILRQALNGLAPIQRQLLALAFFRGLSHQEIAEQTALPLGTIKSHIRRGLTVMREAFTASAQEDYL